MKYMQIVISQTTLYNEKGIKKKYKEETAL